MADKTATFGIQIKAESNAGEAANSVDVLKKRLIESQDAVKKYASSLSKLRGNSQEVTDAKAKLKAAIASERDNVSRATLALGRHGLTIADVAQKTPKASSSLQELAEGWAKSAKETLTFVGIAGLAVEAIKGISESALHAAESLASFIVESGNALRTQNLLREAATGSAQNATNFGHQIDAIASKVPQTRAELNELALSVSKSFAGTRVSGQGAVDTFNAVAQASAAMGDSAGKAIEGIIDRSKMFGRMGLGINELQGTGITFTDVAGQLAKNLKIGLKDAQTSLMYGRVAVNDGARAIRAVVEKRFGDINMRMMLDVDVMKRKFKDTLMMLTEGVDLKPLLKGFQGLGELFSANTVTGKALKDLVTGIGNFMVKGFTAALPFIKTFFKQLVIEAYKLEIGILQINVWLKKTFGVGFRDIANKLFGLFDAVAIGKVVFWTIAAAVGAVATVISIAAVNTALFIKEMDALIGVGESIIQKFSSMTWSDIGRAIIDGIKDGFISGVKGLGNAVSDLAGTIKNKFKDALGIHSPSKVFEEYGAQTKAGYEAGQKGMGEGAGIKALPAGGMGGGGGVSVNMTINLTLPGAKDGKEVQQALTAPSFRAKMTLMLEEMLSSAGVQIHTPQKGIV